MLKYVSVSKYFFGIKQIQNDIALEWILKQLEEAETSDYVKFWVFINLGT